MFLSSINAFINTFNCEQLADHTIFSLQMCFNVNLRQLIGSRTELHPVPCFPQVVVAVGWRCQHHGVKEGGEGKAGCKQGVVVWLAPRQQASKVKRGGAMEHPPNIIALARFGRRAHCLIIIAYELVRGCYHQMGF